MKRLALALALLAAPLAGHQERRQSKPACLYAASMDVSIGKIVVLWGDPPCSRDGALNPRQFVSDLNYDCARITFYAAQTVAEPAEPIVMGSRCQ